MERLPERIMDLGKKVTMCWECFITSRIEEGMRYINEILNDIGKILNEIQNTGLKSFDINQIENTFRKLEMALTFPNYILIADLLNYEIKSILESWQNELRMLT